MSKLSSYVEGLEKEAKARYLEKISLINYSDRFTKPCKGEPFDGVPRVEDCDLVSYVVLQTSFITMAQFKARKGLEAYNQFVCGKLLTCGRVSIRTTLSKLFMQFVIGSSFPAIK